MRQESTDAGTAQASADRLLQVWASAAPDRPLPARADFAPDGNLRPWLGRLAILAVEQDPPRFKAILVGTKIAQMDTVDITGLYLDEAYGEGPSQNILKPYLESLEKRTAVVRQIPLGANGRTTLTQVVLPLADGSEDISHMFVAFIGETDFETFRDAGLIEQVGEASEIPQPSVWKGSGQ